MPRTSQGYYQFIIKISSESQNAVINKLTAIGSLGFFEYDGKIFAYFEDGVDIANICIELENFRNYLKSSGLNPAFSFDYELLPWKDWNESWKKSFLPIDVGDNLAVIPSWVKADTRRIPIIIDPGMAFGTGDHETTRMCLKLVERFSCLGKGRTFLDVGTGTGILSVCASRLGFSRVLGIDTDPVAVETARRNIEINNLENVDIQGGIITHVKGLFDVIVANIYYDVLITIAHEIVSRLKPEGIVILSGMMVSQGDHVISVMEQNGLALMEKIVDGKWLSLIIQ
ncbi:MAG: 50S ribosomal protein L11 methyltransferase [Gammaproteobacteria bacterium]|nr:50S ribosomal protein L11 methyltransferase [Gammaproteobacteria bacterium]